MKIYIGLKVCHEKLLNRVELISFDKELTSGTHKMRS